MILKKLSILNYKNILQAEVSFSPEINCFFGNNGMGKTNLLDAVHYLSFCKSHINTPDSQLINNGQDMCVLQGNYDYEGREEEIFCAIRRRQRKQFKRNKKEYDKLSEHIGLLPLVMVSPADSELIQGGSEERRRFLDVIISQQDKPYLHALIQYNKALLQRNSLLKDQCIDASLYEVLEMQLDMYGRMVYEKRQMLVNDFIPIFNEYYQTICRSTEQVGLRYISQLEKGSLADMLAANRERDRILGYTSTGIHKDELEMTLNGHLIRRVGSQGQNKTYLIALKLAQYVFLSCRGQARPILLLDDIFDKLDADRVEQKNLDRQNFLKEDVGQHKAMVLAQALRDHYGIEVRAYPMYIDSAEQLKVVFKQMSGAYYRRTVPILIGSVDNHRARQEMEKWFRQTPTGIWIDAANEFHTGEVVAAVKKNGKMLSPSRPYYFPEIMRSREKRASELSCGVINQSSPQHRITNMAAAMLALSATLGILRNRFLPYKIVYFDVFKGNAIPVNAGAERGIFFEDSE